MNVIYIDLKKLDATIVYCPRTVWPYIYLRHLAGGRVLKYPIMLRCHACAIIAYVDCCCYVILVRNIGHVLISSETGNSA